MKDFLDALTQFTPVQLITSIAVLAPVVGGIWAAFKWAFETRLKNLETALADFRTDFDRRLARELSETKDAHEATVRSLILKHDSEIERIRLQSQAEILVTQKSLIEVEQERDLVRKTLTSTELFFQEYSTGAKLSSAKAAVVEKTLHAELQTFRKRICYVLKESVSRANMPDAYVEFLVDYPDLVDKVTLGPLQIEVLRERSQPDKIFPYYKILLGRILITSPNSQAEGSALIAAGEASLERRAGR